MLIDTHVHLYSRKFDEDREQAIARAREAGVRAMVLPGIDVQTTNQAIQMARDVPGLFAMAAIHPTETRGTTDSDLDTMRDLCGDPSVVAVGETGLDYYWDRTFDDVQKDFFRRHVCLAMETDLPLVIHSRDRHGGKEVSMDLVQILDEERRAADEPARLRGIFHCFGGPDWLPAEAERLGFLLGLGGTLTYKNSGVADIVASVPLARLVLETDAPYLAPAPHRGRRNEPAWICHVAEKLAEIKGIAVDEVVRRTGENAQRLYDLPEDDTA